MKISILIVLAWSYVFWWYTRFLLWFIGVTIKWLGFLWRNMSNRPPESVPYVHKAMSGEKDITELTQIAMNWLLNGDRINVKKVEKLIGELPNFISMIHNNEHKIFTINNRRVTLTQHKITGNNFAPTTRETEIMFDCLGLSDNQE